MSAVRVLSGPLNVLVSLFICLCAVTVWILSYNYKTIQASVRDPIGGSGEATLTVTEEGKIKIFFN